MSKPCQITTRVELLKCPVCHQDLSGWPCDRMYFCQGCRIGVNFSENPVAVEPVFYQKISLSDPDETIWCPVWRMDVEVNVDSQDPALIDRVKPFIPDRIWVFGMVISRMNVYGNPCIEFSRMVPEWDSDGPGRPVWGCQILKSHALQLADPVATALIDQEHDVTGLKIHTLVRKIDLHAIPFRIGPHALTHPGTGFVISRAAVSINPWLENLYAGDPKR